jgi:hypothetical protein
LGALGWYLVLLGFAAGMAVLCLTAYSRVGPSWLRWSLLACGALAIGRYAAMASFASGDPSPAWLPILSRAWLGTSIGLTWPTVVAVDQLVRHPAMTPQKLVRSYAPFLALYLIVLLFGRFGLVPDPIARQAPELMGWARAVLSLTQAVFVGLVLWFGLLLARKIPSAWIRAALAGLLLAHAYLAVDGAILAGGGWYFRPFLFSELLALAALWFAFDTARHHPL